MTEHDPRANLVPFVKGSERAREAGRKSAESRKARKTASVATSQAAAAALTHAATSFQRDQLGPNAAAAAQLIIGRVATGDIPVRNGDEAAALLRALVDVARLEEGQHTSASIIAHADTGAMLARIAELRERATTAIEATSTTATAAADDEGGVSNEQTTPATDVDELMQGE